MKTPRLLSPRLHALLTLVVGFAWTSPLVAQPSPAAHPIPSPVSFRNHVESVLTKAGCNMGACHGAAAGKNGFTLSLRGYHPDADFDAITRNGFGRRIIPDDPARSLLLLKATGAVPHKGGKRFDTGSPEYLTLAHWIAAGAPGPHPSDPTLTRLEVVPPRLTTQPGATHSIEVKAHFSNGRVETVTRWAKFSSANEQVANIDDLGQIRIIGHGEGALNVWYLSQLVAAQVTVPFTNAVSNASFAQLPKRNFIDEQILSKLAELKIPPSPPSSDSEFIRRAYLDTIGVLPTPSEVRKFLASNAPNKRDELIEHLLARPEWIDYWTYKWSDLLLVSSSRLPTRIARSYHAWVRHHVEANTPWDQVVRELLTAQGSTAENGAVAYFLLHDDPRTMAENATQAFMGMSVGCAKCHNHPNEKWTNDDYYALANFFSRVRIKNTATEDRVLFAALEGDLIQPRTGRPQSPRSLDSAVSPPASAPDRRTALATWLTSPQNPFFAKSIANRIWANFFGVGLVEKVDDLRVSNPASNEVLLTGLAQHLVAQNHDLKALMRAILQSHAYQRSSTVLPGNASDSRFYSRAYPRRLLAEVILDGVSQVTGVPTDFLLDARQGQRPEIPFPSGIRALQLPDSFVASQFLKNFGRPDRSQTCECERSAEPSVAQVLHLANGDTLNQKLARRGNRVDELLQKFPSHAAVIEELFLAAYARTPTAAELKPFEKALREASDSDRRAVLEDIFWALLSSKEFLFNH